MQELIEKIRASVEPAATNEQKAAGAHACRTIAAALDGEPGKPLALPGQPTSQPRASLSFDQMLEMAIAKLTMMANERDKNPPAPPATTTGLPVPVSRPTLPGVAPRPMKKPAPVKPGAVRKP